MKEVSLVTLAEALSRWLLGPVVAVVARLWRWWLGHDVDGGDGGALL